MEQKKGLRWNSRTSNIVLGWCLVAPLLLWLLLTVIYPLCYTFWLSMQNQELLGAKSEFVWLETYKVVLSDKEFWNALKNSLIWTVGNSILQGIGGLTVGLLLNQRFKGCRFMRVWIILPWIIPTVVMAIMWKWMLSSTFGVLGWLLVKSGLCTTAPNFLGDPFNAMPTLILINSWRWIPFMAVVILAALQTIPDDLYEAAAVDGAGPVKKFLTITLPGVAGTTTTMFLIGTLFSFNMFDVVWLMTEGGPLNYTTTLPVLIYKSAFKTFRVSQAAAISVVVFVILACFVALASRMSALKDLEGDDRG